MPFPRRPHRASPDEIKITRDGDDAIITYADPKVATTHLRVGREKLATMTDEEILADWNDGIDAREELAKEYEHVAVEVPIGHPQVKYEERAHQWVPRGHVLRCVVEGYSEGDPEQPFVSIYDQDFTLAEFAKMVGTFGGWGMRITFVPDDDVHDEPVVEVREPDPQPLLGDSSSARPYSRLTKTCSPSGLSMSTQAPRCDTSRRSAIATEIIFAVAFSA